MGGKRRQTSLYFKNPLARVSIESCIVNNGAGCQVAVNKASDRDVTLCECLPHPQTSHRPDVADCERHSTHISRRSAWMMDGGSSSKALTSLTSNIES